MSVSSRGARGVHRNELGVGLGDIDEWHRDIHERTVDFTVSDHYKRNAQPESYVVNWMAFPCSVCAEPSKARVVCAEFHGKDVQRYSSVEQWMEGAVHSAHAG